MAKIIATALLALSLSLSSPLLGQRSGESTFGHYVPSYDKVSEYEGYSTFIRASDDTRLAPKQALGGTSDAVRRPAILKCYYST